MCLPFLGLTLKRIVHPKMEEFLLFFITKHISGAVTQGSSDLFGTDMFPKIFLFVISRTEKCIQDWNNQNMHKQFWGEITLK